MVEQADGFRSLDDTEQHVTVARVEFGGTQRDHPPEGEVWGSFLGCRGDTLQGKTVERRPAAESLGFKGPGLYCVRLRVSVWLCFSVSGCYAALPSPVACPPRLTSSPSRVEQCSVFQRLGP